LPGNCRDGPTVHAERKEYRACLRHGCDAEAAVEGRKMGHHHRADQEMYGDGRRDQGERPATPVVDRVQVDGRTVKAHAESESGEDKGRADDAPAVECIASLMHPGSVVTSDAPTLRRRSNHR